MKNHVLWRRRIFLAAIAILIAVGLFYGFRPQPVAVDLGAASRGPLRVTVEQEGKTRVIDRYVISAPVAAYAQRIDFEVGDSVEQGAPVVRLEPMPADGSHRAGQEIRLEGPGRGGFSDGSQVEANTASRR